jgi:23S rRNA (pseudouridine1915-N3)-methyltransferase
VFKIKIVTIGKTKEKWLLLALQEYEKRLSSQLQVEWMLAKDERDFLKQTEKEERFVLLDAKAELLSSEEFSKKIFALFAQNKCRLTFLIGGPQGLSETLKKKAMAQLSLSPLTFTHQIVRLVFLEQLFRSFEIVANSSYHK